MKQKIILASLSPFRKKLMEKTELSFESHAPACDEENLKKSCTSSPEELPSLLAKEKALSLKSLFESDIIIGSDQILLEGTRILGKANDFEGAVNQLKSCSGKAAKLLTAVYLYDGKKSDLAFTNKVELHFKDLNEKQIEAYVKKDQPFSCAGSFMFEKKGLFLFEKIDCEDPSAIEGLPLMRLCIELEKKGFNLPFL